MRREIVKRTGVLCVAVMAIAGIAFAKTYHLTSTPMVPAATGTLEVGHDKNGNLEVELKVEHLAKPSLRTPPESTYVVWFQQGGSDPQIQGELRVNDDLKGNFKTTRPYHSFDVLVTAETDSHPQVLSDRLAMKTSVQEAK